MNNYSKYEAQFKNLLNTKMEDLETDEKTIELARKTVKDYSDSLRATSDCHIRKHYDKHLLFNNIRYLLRKNNIKLGDIEKEASVAPGYMSRLDKEFSSAEPSLEFVFTAAKLLNCSIDSLLKIDLSKLSTNEDYILNFLNKLIKETDNDVLTWNVEKYEYLKSFSDSDSCDHPLFTIEKFEDVFFNNTTIINRMIFKSNNYGKNTLIGGDGYNLEMPGNCRLYVMKVKNNTVNCPASIEIWMYNEKNNTVKPLITTADINLSKVLITLYEKIESSVKRPTIDKDLKSVIDAFMEK